MESRHTLKNSPLSFPPDVPQHHHHPPSSPQCSSSCWWSKIDYFIDMQLTLDISYLTSSVIRKKKNKIKGCSAKIELLAFLHRREKKKGISLWFFDNNKSRGPDTGPLARAPNGRKTDRDHVEMPVIDGKYIICTSMLFAVLHRLIFIRGRRARGFQEPSGANAGVAAFHVGVIIYGESFFA